MSDNLNAPTELGRDQYKVNRSNAVWGVLEYLAQAISLLFLTPLLLSYLGKESFGLLVISTSIMGINGIFSLGMGPATLHYVAKYREEGRQSALRRLVETSIITNLTLGTVACVAVLALANVIPIWFKNPPSASSQTLLTIIRLAGIALPFVFLANTMDSTLRGFEEFNIAVPIRALCLMFTTITQIVLVISGYGIVSLIVATVVFQVVRAISAWIATRFYVMPDLRLIPRFSLLQLRQFISYGFYVWLTSIVGTARQSGEMLILAAILGPGMLAIYAIPTRVLTQVHLLLSKTFAYIFPYATKLLAADDTAGIDNLYAKGTRSLCVLSAAAVSPIAVCCGPLLSLWLEPEVAAEIQPVLQILAIRFAVFPLSILNSNLLLAAGETRIMTVIMTLNTIVVLPLMTVLAFRYGVIGAALAQLVVFGPILFNRFYVERTLFGRAKFSTVALPVFLIVAPLVMLLLFVRIPLDYDLLNTFVTGVMIACLTAGICWFIAEGVKSPLTSAA